MFSSLNQKVKAFKHFLSRNLWLLDLDSLKPTKAWFYKILQIIIFTNQQYSAKKCSLRASSLTLLTLFSIVPLFALAFGIANSFGLEETLREYIYQSFGDHQEVLNNVLTYSENLLHSTQGGIVAGIGLLILIFTIMRLLYYIEEAFNDIWEIKKSRSFIRILTDYLSIMIIAPILLVFSNDIFIIAIEYTVNFFSRTYITNTLPFDLSVLSSARYLLFGLMLSLLYIIMPNMIVKTKHAIIAGIITGATYIIVEVNYISLQSSVSNYNKVYGSFAIFPLFLIWLQISWYIILYGAALTYSMSNVKKYHLKQLGTNCTNYQNTILAISIMHFIAKNFDHKRGPTSIKAIMEHLESSYLKLPEDAVNQLLNILVQAKLLVLVQSSDDEQRLFLPYLTTATISIEHIYEVFNAKAKNKETFNLKTLLDDKIFLVLEEADKLRKDVLNRYLLKDF